jgi:hypothetical protein
MKKFRIFLLGSLLTTISYIQADLRIKSWYQKNICRRETQEVEVLLELEAVALPPHHFHQKWGIIFPPGRRIQILEARVLDQLPFESSFGDNQLKFTFAKLYNGQVATIKFSYQLPNTAEGDYLQHIPINIPVFGANALAHLEVHPPNSFKVISHNSQWREVDGIYHWDGVVETNGFEDIFSITPAEAIWKVTTTITLEDPQGIGNLEVQLPQEYKGGTNEILAYEISHGQGNNYHTNSSGDLLIKFKNFQVPKTTIQLNVLLKNSHKNFENTFDPTSNTYLDPDLAAILRSRAQNILAAIPNPDLPYYARLAKWVHNYLTYDEQLVGKKISTSNLLESRRGVCEHYALLYQDLLRSMYIPAKAVGGLGYNFRKKKFEAHAWVMVYHNNEWIPVDPTWDMYTGKLPISHIFLHEDLQHTIVYQRPGSLKNLTISVERDAKWQSASP